jgi:hypothetical protein
MKKYGIEDSIWGKYLDRSQRGGECGFDRLSYLSESTKQRVPIDKNYEEEKVQIAIPVEEVSLVSSYLNFPNIIKAPRGLSALEF